jgi:carboxyl-terminal processing protease
MMRLQTVMSKIAHIITIATFGFIVQPAYAGSHPDSDIIPSVETTFDANDIHHFISTLALVKHYYLEDVSTKELIDNAITGMVSQLDPHSNYLSGTYFQQLQNDINGEFGGIGVEIMHEQGALKVISPIDDTPAAKAGIKAQDLIVRINGSLVSDMNLHQAIHKIRGKRGSQVTLTIIREGEEQPIDFAIKRDIIKIQSVKSKLLDGTFGYVKLNTFQNNGRDELVQALTELHEQAKQPLQGLVLDMRNNPGGLLHVAVDIADMFLDAKEMKKNKLIVFTKGKHPDSRITAMATAGEMLDDVPIVILMNRGSASAAEIVAGALQDHKRAIVVGDTSFGKGSVQTIIPTMDGTGALKLTTALYYTPLGRSIQAKGIEPDLVVSDIELPDQKTEALAIMSLSEKDLEGHLTTGLSNPVNTQGQDPLMLAKKDYQLYQALNILKGLSMLKEQSSPMH